MWVIQYCLIRKDHHSLIINEKEKITLVFAIPHSQIKIKRLIMNNAFITIFLYNTTITTVVPVHYIVSKFWQIYRHD